MIKEYDYYPPYKYLLVGIAGLIATTLFGVGILKNDEIWFRIVISFFFLLTLAVSIGFITLYIRNFNLGNLKIGDDFIEIPGRWKRRTTIKFNQIKNIGEFDTYDHVIAIESEFGYHLIERQWMISEDFVELRERLQTELVE